MLVSHALGDYPQVAKLLRWQPWDGSAMVVADDLVRRLDGLQPVPGVAALGLLAQAIEPMVGGAHQQRLVEMRRRHAWGVDPAPAGADVWHDDRAPAELVHERIIGENTLRHVCYLQQALRATDAVVKIDVHGRGSGTGFLIAPDLMLTFQIVLNSYSRSSSLLPKLPRPGDGWNGELNSETISIVTIDADRGLAYHPPASRNKRPTFRLAR